MGNEELKIGTEVTVKTLEELEASGWVWHKNEGYMRAGKFGFAFTNAMFEFCGKTFIIKEVFLNLASEKHYLLEDRGYGFTEEMLVLDSLEIEVMRIKKEIYEAVF